MKKSDIKKPCDLWYSPYGGETLHLDIADEISARVRKDLWTDSIYHWFIYQYSDSHNPTRTIQSGSENNKLDAQLACEKALITYLDSFKDVIDVLDTRGSDEYIEFLEAALHEAAKLGCMNVVYDPIDDNDSKFTWWYGINRTTPGSKLEKWLINNGYLKHE